MIPPLIIAALLVLARNTRPFVVVAFVKWSHLFITAYSASITGTLTGFFDIAAFPAFLTLAMRPTAFKSFIEVLPFINLVSSHTYLHGGWSNDYASGLCM